MSKLNISADDCTPYVDLAIGIFFGSLFLAAAAFTLETTQALFLHQNANDLTIQWSTFMQIPDAMRGQYSGARLDAILWSWVILSCYIMMASIKAWIAKGIAEEVLEFLCYLMMAFDGFANFRYMDGHEWYYQWGFMAMIALVLMFFGRLSIKFLIMAMGKAGGR